MYTYRPDKKNAFGIILSALLLTAGIFFLSLGITVKGNTGSLFSVFSTVLLIFGAMIAARYVFRSYEYAVDGGIFTVKEQRWKKQVVCVRIALFEIDEIITVKNRKDKKLSSPNRRDCVCKIYDYRPELFPKEYHILITRNPNYCNEGEELRILVRLDTRMADILSGR